MPKVRFYDAFGAIWHLSLVKEALRAFARTDKILRVELKRKKWEAAEVLQVLIGFSGAGIPDVVVLSCFDKRVSELMNQRC